MNEDNRNEIEDNSTDSDIGFTAGMLIGGVIVACILAIFITITLKVMKWIWWL